MKYLFYSCRIKKCLQAALLLAILLFNFGPGGTSITHAAPPANDDFAAATLITGISYTNALNLNEATQDVTDPDNVGPCDGNQLNVGNNSVWYKYTPGVNESLAVDTKGSTFAPGDDLDTFIAVWTGTEGNLNLVECDDDNLAGQTSEMSFVAIAGTTYYFEVAVFNCFEGDPPNCGQQVGGNLVFNINITNTNAYIAGALKGRYYVYPDSFTADRYGINGGPVRVLSTSGVPIFTSQRAIYLNSFNSIVGYPGNQLTTEYWFTTYDGVGMITYLVIGNPSTSQTAQVDVYIGGNKMNTSGPIQIGPGQRVFPTYAVNSGPVRVVSTNGVNIFASERTKFKFSFNEVMGYPGNQVHTEFWFTSYDNVGMITYLVIGNPSTSQTAQVDVYIGGNKMNTSGPIQIGPGQRVFPRYAVNSGPVRVVSTNGVNIFASERTKFKESFNEVMGYPGNKVHTEFWFTSYDDVSMITYLVIGNPSTSQTAQVDVYIAGVKKNGASIQIGPGQRFFQRYEINTGSVQVVSTNGVNVFASERSKYLESFNEILGMAGNQLTTEYWFTSYDDVGLTTDLVIGTP